MKNLEDFIYPTQRKLFVRLCKKYKDKTLACLGNFILVRGEVPVMLVAHLDTVHAESVRDLCKSGNGNILMSPQGIGGDDRCGVYALTSVYDMTDKKPWLLFTCNEETGGIGARMFCHSHAAKKLPAELDTLKFIVEIDRRGSNDAVYYDCANFAFEEYVSTKGFVTAHGSFSDIYINRAELENTIEKVAEMVNDAALADFPAFEYVDAVYNEDDSIYFSEIDLFHDLK